MIIYSIKSLITYESSEALDLVNPPKFVIDKNLYTDYYNFINSIQIIYSTKEKDGTIPVFWTKIKNNLTLEREADPNSTLIRLEPGQSYYIVLLDKSKLPVKIPKPLDKKSFLHLENNEQVDPEPCYIEPCRNNIVILEDSHRNISLNSDTGATTNIHIPISGLIPDKNYTFIIEPIDSNWPNKLSKTSGTISRNSPLDQYGYVTSSIDSKFMYLYIDGENNFSNSLPYTLIDTSKTNHSQNIFSLFWLKIYEDNNLVNLDTINILCDTCVPTQTPIQSSTPTPTPTPTITPTITPSTSLPNNPNFYFIASSIDQLCFNPQYVILIYGEPQQLNDVLYKDVANTNFWTLNELKNYINEPTATNIFIKNRSVSIIGGEEASLVSSIIDNEGIAVIGSQQVCPEFPPTPTPTPSQTVPLTPTPTETPYESNRKCPQLNILQKNIVLTNTNAVEIVAEFSYIDPNRNYGFEFINNSSNWPALISPISDKITNYAIYTEDNLTYGSGTIKSTLFLNKDSRSYFNLAPTIPEYIDENFFQKNIYLNLELIFSRQTTLDENYDDIILYPDFCQSIKDSVNILCDSCINIDREVFDCTQAVKIAINGSNLNYPPLSQSSRPGSEITIQESCCDKINNVYADVSGLCPTNLYRYEWSSYPLMTINPSSGLFAVGEKNTRIHTTFNLGDNAITNLKLKIFNVDIGNYVEDNVLIRCGNKCAQPLAVTPEPTPTPTLAANLTFDDYILIFIDEAEYPSAPGVFGYYDKNQKPVIYWYQDMDVFKPLYENNLIDINKVLIFNVRMSNCKRLAIHPRVQVPPGYEMPIPLSRIIDTPRNNPACLVNGQSLTGSWILGQVQAQFPNLSNQRINILIDDSPSLRLNAINQGIVQFENLIKSTNNYRRVLCRTERWLRWIVNVFNSNPICS